MKHYQTNSKPYRKNVTALVTGCALYLSTIAVTVQAETPKPKCDAVLAACLEYNETLEKESKILKDVIKRQDEKLREADSSKGLPWYFYFLAGVTGAFVFQGFTK